MPVVAVTPVVAGMPVVVHKAGLDGCRRWHRLELGLMRWWGSDSGND